MKVCPAKVYSRYLGNIQPKLANMCSDDCTYYEIGNNGVWPCINFKKLKAKKEKDRFFSYCTFFKIQFNVVTANFPIPENKFHESRFCKREYLNK